MKLKYVKDDKAVVKAVLDVAKLWEQVIAGKEVKSAAWSAAERGGLQNVAHPYQALKEREMSRVDQAHKLLGPWTLQSAIAERVEKEATLAWALKEDAPFHAIPPIKAERWPSWSLHVLRSQVRQLIA